MGKVVQADHLLLSLKYSGHSSSSKLSKRNAETIPWHDYGAVQVNIYTKKLDSPLYGLSNSVPERPKWLIWIV